MSEVAYDPTPRPESARELTALQEEFGSLDGTVTELLDRLSPFLPDVPREVTASQPPDGKVPSAQTPYGRQLRELNHGVSDLRARVASVLNRLEI